ncbi:Tim44 domain-containing protein, partial [Clostridium tarantellae]
GGSSSSGSSGSSSSSYGGSNGRYNSTAQGFSPVGVMIFGVYMAIFFFKKNGKHIIAINNRKRQTLSEIKNFEIDNPLWEFYSIEEQIEEAFFIIQKAWMNRDYSKAKEFMSYDLYDIHNMKVSWMKIRGEKNILKNIKILSIKPIKAISSTNGSTNKLWVSIRAKMIDYTINENTKMVKSGNTMKSDAFEEYWRFILKDNRWVADKIMQTDEVDLDYFDKLK